MRFLYMLLALVVSLLADNEVYVVAFKDDTKTNSTPAFTSEVRTLESTPMKEERTHGHAVAAVPHNIVTTPDSPKKKTNSKYYNNGVKQRIERFFDRYFGIGDGVTHGAARL
ncbi:RxLR-like protein [Plasmopara halstedii]|uniref:RxLR-like protein n=1 Tax=Plasmopara halstedii TaxID=4781 RepID=A0A0N7L517_PLAHL|nr:RxLR-like protein [Plasmopara halstedii]CEG40227.1 RxLR-like protein [Plasmopara halstedii]|eukprot:XP_024576596.1 RxLR-like protein [Plasmopara halstedii]